MRRAVPIVLSVAALVALFLLLRPGGGAPGPDPATSPIATVTPGDGSTSPATEDPASPASGVREIEVSFSNGEADGPDRVAVPSGTRVRIVVTSDVSEEVHVHTYDFKKEVGPGSPAVFEFVADISGVFEVELEGSHVLLFRLEVGA